MRYIVSFYIFKIHYSFETSYAHVLINTKDHIALWCGPAPPHVDFRFFFREIPSPSLYTWFMDDSKWHFSFMLRWFLKRIISFLGLLRINIITYSNLNCLQYFLIQLVQRDSLQLFRAIHKLCGHGRVRGICLMYIISLIFFKRERGSKMSKKLSSWFMSE